MHAPKSRTASPLGELRRSLGPWLGPRPHNFPFEPATPRPVKNFLRLPTTMNAVIGKKCT